MTASAKAVIEGFESLPDVEKREVLATLLRSVKDLEYPEVSDDELTAAADEVFLEYDRRESGE